MQLPDFTAGTEWYTLRIPQTSTSFWSVVTSLATPQLHTLQVASDIIFCTPKHRWRMVKTF